MNARTINAPECFICDDAGVVPGKEVFSAALCNCSSGQSLAGGVQRMSAEHHAAAGGILAVPSSSPEFTFGAISIDREGLSYRGVRIEDAGRAYRTLMAVLHNKEPNPDDRPPRYPARDIALQDMALLIERMAQALAKTNPLHGLIQNAEGVLKRYGFTPAAISAGEQAEKASKALAGLAEHLIAPQDAKPLPGASSWPVAGENVHFTLERRDDPHNPSNRHNPLNLGRRRSDRDE